MRLFSSFAAAIGGYVLLSGAGADLSAWLVLPAALGFFALLGSRQSRQTFSGGVQGSQWEKKWSDAATELDLRGHVRSDKNNYSTMRGEIDGHRVSVACVRNGDPDIEVRFESGLRFLDIDPRRKPARPTDISTGDPLFDEAFRVRSHDDSGLRTWLTPQRREILVVLNDALDLREVEEDELEMKLGTDDWSASELVQAVQLCVLAAQTLDRSYQPRQSPQDVVRPDKTPQDAPIPDNYPQDGRGPSNL